MNCYKTNSIILLLLGILIGLCFNKFNIDFFKSNNVNDRKDEFEACGHISPDSSITEFLRYNKCIRDHLPIK